MKACAIIVLASGCATLGPMPGSTGIAAIPAASPEVAVQLGAMPGHYLSSSVAAESNGAAIPQLLAALDPGEHVPGLVVAGRAYGESGDTAFEPVIGYRKQLGRDRRFAVAALLYGTRMSTSADHATYVATRAGLEGAADVRLTREHRWIEAHAFGSASITNLTADGSYCVDGDHAIDCPEPFPEPPPEQASAEITGVYPAITVGVAAELFRHRASVFHGARVEARLGAGAMPRVVDGEQASAEGYLTIGLAVTLAFGAR